MKNQILDTPFRDSFSDFLEKGEEILWEHSPKKSMYAIRSVKSKFYSNATIFKLLLGALLIGIFAYSIKTSVYWFNILFLPCIFIFTWINQKINFISNYSKYAITSKKILFKASSKKVTVYQIPLSKIKNCLIGEQDGSKGTIFIVVKNPEEISFDTFFISSSGNIEKRHCPTLENIQHPEKIANLIRQGIQNNK